MLTAAVGGGVTQRRPWHAEARPWAAQLEELARVLLLPVADAAVEGAAAHGVGANVRADVEMAREGEDEHEKPSPEGPARRGACGAVDLRVGKQASGELMEADAITRGSRAWPAA